MAMQWMDRARVFLRVLHWREFLPLRDFLPLRNFLALRDFLARRRFLPLRDFLPGGALHPLRRPRGEGLICGRRALVLIALAATRRYLLIGPAHAGERIGLTDQPREFSQRIAFSPSRRGLVAATIMIVARRKRSILISISHRDDACPSGKPPTHF
jgi:hypothetical protein